MNSIYIRRGVISWNYVHGETHKAENLCGKNLMVWRGVGLFPSGCDEGMAQLLIDVSVANGGSPTEIRDKIVRGLLSFYFYNLKVSKLIALKMKVTLDLGIMW